MKITSIIFILALLIALLCYLLPAQAESINLANQLPAVAIVTQTPEELPPDSSTSTLDVLLSMFSSIETKVLYVYSFDQHKGMLGALASYPLWNNERISLNVDAVLISDDGLSLGLGAGMTIKNVLSVLDVMAGYTPQQGTVLGVGINKAI